MYKICVFAGTTEGRELVSFLSRQMVCVTVCVATEYGESLIPEGDNLTLSHKRLTQPEMEELFRSEGFDLVVDATHPYASAVTENVHCACQNTHTAYLRLNRAGQAVSEDAVYVSDIAEAVAFLNQTEGNILLTTGSKELVRYTGIRKFSSRVYVRVLPMIQSLELCQKAGVKPDHILAMQGPFTKEMNLAMLNSIGAKFLVTKDSGANGGFAEKQWAAQHAGVTQVILGRPPQQAGLSFRETLDFLCKRYGFAVRPEITILGIGPGDMGMMTQEAKNAIAAADCIIGAQRMVEAVAKNGQKREFAISPEAICNAIENNRQCQRFVVAMSGDVGLYSGTKKLLPLLEGQNIRVIPGISSLVYLCAKLGVSYEDVVTVSLHGRQESILPEVRRHRKVFALVGGENGIGKLCKELVDAGLGQTHISVGEKLSYPQERITIGTAQELTQYTFPELSVALLENPHAMQHATHGLPDEAFRRRESVPMTKSEVRSVCLSKLSLKKDSLCWDIGSGSGSVAIEMALRAYGGHTYAIECKEDALSLLSENIRLLGTENVIPVPGRAPEVCEGLPAPTHAFIGGSSGNMNRILTLLLQKNPKVRVVATAVTLESVAELTACMQELPFARTEVVTLSVAKARELGAYHLMAAQNPIYIFTMEGGKAL